MTFLWAKVGLFFTGGTTQASFGDFLSELSLLVNVFSRARGCCYSFFFLFFCREGRFPGFLRTQIYIQVVRGAILLRYCSFGMETNTGKSSITPIIYYAIHTFTHKYRYASKDKSIKARWGEGHMFTVWQWLTLAIFIKGTRLLWTKFQIFECFYITVEIAKYQR